MHLCQSHHIKAELHFIAAMNVQQESSPTSTCMLSCNEGLVPQRITLLPPNENVPRPKTDKPITTYSYLSLVSILGEEVPMNL